CQASPPCSSITCCGTAGSILRTKPSPAIARGRCSTNYMRPAVLVAMMNPPADEDAFNAWYDEEHVPLRLAVPGFLSGRRYRAAEAEGPRYLALYDLGSLDVLQSEAYQRLWREQSEREKAMLASIPFMDRRVCE